MNFLETLEKLNPFSRQDDQVQDDYSRLEQQDREDDSKFDTAQSRVNLLRKGGSVGGFDLAVDAFDHYQYGDGKELTLPYGKIAGFATIKEALAKNQSRLLSSLSKPGTLFKRKGLYDLEPTDLTSLKDNDRVVLKDYYDVDNAADKVVKNFDSDLGFSLGSFKLRSRSNLEFSKSGDKLLPSGYASHDIRDAYDFNPDSNYRVIADPLENAKKARPFSIKSQWQSRPMGVIKTNGNEVDTSGVEWESY